MTASELMRDAADHHVLPRPRVRGVVAADAKRLDRADRRAACDSAQIYSGVADILTIPRGVGAFLFPERQFEFGRYRPC